MKMIKNVFSKAAALALACFGFTSTMQAVVPAPDGGYPRFNTAEGQNALFNLTTGVANSAVGWYSLFSNTDGSYNTALGAGTLLFNVGDQSTGAGTQNTAVGTAALLSNTTGSENTAVGSAALLNNTASVNTAIGFRALLANTTGTDNTATGHSALLSNTEGFENTANGFVALYHNTTGSGNAATGGFALFSNTTGIANTANGNQALQNSNGSANTAIGNSAGANLVTGGGNVYIGAGVYGEDGVSNSTYIRNVYDSVATARQVYVDANNKIGTMASTRRVKDDIEPMARASETILALRPVTFRYKKEIDRYCTPQFGLIAEDVAKIDPDLVTRDTQGEPETVRYDAVNAMLLNEFLKEHKTVQELKKEIAGLRATVKEQGSKIQSISDQLELNKPWSQLVDNNP